MAGHQRRFPLFPASGWLNGLVGITIFSGSMPATRTAVETLDPLFVTAARASIAGALAAAALAASGARPPEKRDLGSLAIVASGVVIGFPLLSAQALAHITSARAIVFTSLLPLVTASFAVWWAGERPRAAFWPCSVLGCALMAGYAMRNGAPVSPRGDGLMLIAIVLCGLGYAEGGLLARRFGGWRTICWALALSLPLTSALAVSQAPSSWETVAWRSVAGLAYVSVFSMLIGFVFWYRGLAQGGIAAVGQLQVLQPMMGLALSAALLGEDVTGGMALIALAIAICAAAARHFASPSASR